MTVGQAWPEKFQFMWKCQNVGGKYSSFIFGGNFKFQNLNARQSFSVVCDCGNIAFLGLICALQHMRKSLDMIILHLFHIHFEPNNTFPQHLYPHVALFDPIGSPLVSLSKWGQTVAKVKLKRSQSVDILTLPTVWPLYPVLSLSLAPISAIYPQFSSLIHSLSSVYPGLSTHYHQFICSQLCFIPCSPHTSYLLV